MIADSCPSSLLIVGGTKAGKTHYGGQLLRRLVAKKCRLRMLGTPSDLTPFQEVLERLALGRSASHTPRGFYRESIWHVRSEDRTLESQLVWPDYAGEQIENIIQLRQVAEPWAKRIRESNGWLFFVRLSTISAPEDVLNRPRAREQMQASLNTASIPTEENLSGSDGTTPAEGLAQLDAALTPRVTLSTQAGLVELLQALLFVKQVGMNTQLRRPAIVIALSCWDEIPDAKADGGWEDPAKLLRRRLPLLSQFIESNWEPDFVEVIGLSALGKALQDDVGDEAFMDNGPERQGWCVGRDGVQSPDLTLPVTILMERTIGP